MENLLVLVVSMSLIIFIMFCFCFIFVAFFKVMTKEIDFAFFSFVFVCIRRVVGKHCVLGSVGLGENRALLEGGLTIV